MKYLIYLIVTAGTTYLVRMLPLVLMKGKITNRFLLSFLHYIPYSVLAAMTLPAALYATGNIISGAAGLLAGSFFAYKEKGLTFVACVSCLTAFATEIIILLIK